MEALSLLALTHYRDAAVVRVEDGVVLSRVDAAMPGSSSFRFPTCWTSLRKSPRLTVPFVPRTSSDTTLI